MRPKFIHPSGILPSRSLKIRGLSRRVYRGWSHSRCGRNIAECVWEAISRQQGFDAWVDRPPDRCPVFDPVLTPRLRTIVPLSPVGWGSCVRGGRRVPRAKMRRPGEVSAVSGTGTPIPNESWGCHCCSAPRFSAICFRFMVSPGSPWFGSSSSHGNLSLCPAKQSEQGCETHALVQRDSAPDPVLKT